MSAGTSAPAPKEKKFGVKVCRERNCPELKGDPKYPESPQRCELIGGMPGVMSCCIKEADDDEFIRRIHGLNLSPSNAQRPGVRNCPKTCPYKIFIDGEKFVWEKGKAQGKKIPAKIGTCAFTGKAFDEWSTCPCNVLGNPRQEDQIKRLQIIVSARLRNTNPTIGLCNMGICPDGKNRGGPSTEDDLCPVIRLPYDEINIGRGCPLWRIPAKMLPATIAQAARSGGSPRRCCRQLLRRIRLFPRNRPMLIRNQDIRRKNPPGSLHKRRNRKRRPSSSGTRGDPAGGSSAESARTKRSDRTYASSRP